jgi:hypothetical protein
MKPTGRVRGRANIGWKIVQLGRIARTREIAPSGDGQNPAGWNPIPIHPRGSPSPHPPIQDKLLIAISESRRALPKSARHPRNVGLDAHLTRVRVLGQPLGQKSNSYK